MNRANLGPIAPDAPVFGACRPGHLGGDVEAWTAALVDRGIDTVCCLLSDGEARRWKLPERYGDAFATAHVPIRDRHLPDPDDLRRALDVLATATADGGAAAIHCNAGLGRTGVVAAAWLARERDLAPEAAVVATEDAPVPRAPREAIRDDNASEAELLELLARVADTPR
jgi:atypical dual specificity phosphatase